MALAPVTAMENDNVETPLMGLAVLMTQACSGADLTEIARQLMARITRSPGDANALMDLATISHLWFKHDIGLATQAQALKLRKLYHLPATGTPRLRLLAFMHHGDLAANMPVEFLLQGSDIALDMLYIDPTQPFPERLPEHDLIFIAVGESKRSQAVLDLLQQQMHAWTRPVLNCPERIRDLSRDHVSRMLQTITGIDMPCSANISREELAQLDTPSLPLTTLLADGTFPIIVRPVDSHAGQGLEKIETPVKLTDYLQTRPEDRFYISRFVDYRNSDGWYRKYRIVLIDGQAYAGHMAISDHWMIHYLNAHMNDSQQKRDEEAHFMAHFNDDFGTRHGQALQAIHQAAGLDYLVIDCGETADGKLLIFEIDSAAVIHGMDPIDIFPYKQAQVQTIFSAFAELLTNTHQSARQVDDNTP